MGKIALDDEADGSNQRQAFPEHECGRFIEAAHSDGKEDREHETEPYDDIEHYAALDPEDDRVASGDPARSARQMRCPRPGWHQFAITFDRGAPCVGRHGRSVGGEIGHRSAG